MQWLTSTHIIFFGIPPSCQRILPGQIAEPQFHAFYCPQQSHTAADTICLWSVSICNLFWNRSMPFSLSAILGPCSYSQAGIIHRGGMIPLYLVDEGGHTRITPQDVPWLDKSILVAWSIMYYRKHMTVPTSGRHAILSHMREDSHIEIVSADASRSDGPASAGLRHQLSPRSSLDLLVPVQDQLYCITLPGETWTNKYILPR